MELLVPTVSDIVFKYTWPIPNYKKTIAKKSIIDSSPFELNVNGIQSTWNMSIRFWKGPEGNRITNPVVLCLNMLNCTVHEVEQARIRFQFAVFNAEVKHWEYCHVSRTVLELKSTSDIISLGYRDLSIVDRHLKKTGDVEVMVKIQIIQCESEKHNLSQDMTRLLRHSRGADTKVTCAGDDGTEIPVHSSIVAARSSVLADMIKPVLDKVEQSEFYEDNDNVLPGVNENVESHDKESVTKNKEKTRHHFKLDLLDFSKELTYELLRYIYTDHVDNLDSLAAQLLPLAERFQLQGLKELCERNLIETITPENVATLLLIADEYGCDPLKRACLACCEDNILNINKSLAWKVMEQVNPELFNEVCEAGIGSSRSSNIDDSD
ncbi:speckle-type POZ protein isoform X2 [Cephus cinctus]|nr:speckle-type POZ protein isoform X2 [Cephus cinctus]XP_015596703.1 speckle-type POZ protein isoform X2 [Cephus cinctus]XP_024941560.1 speckle-type POZ protein isoform X2 [Cephus cinctus]